MFHRKTNVYDVLENELKRLHTQLDKYNELDMENSTIHRINYGRLLDEVIKINDKLLEIAELEVDNSH